MFNFFANLKLGTKIMAGMLLFTLGALYVGFEWLLPEKFGITFCIIVSIITTIAAAVVAWIVTKSITLQIDKVIADLTSTSTSVLNASNSLTNTSHQLAEGTSEQAASVQETSSTMEESASMIQQTTQNTKEAVVLAEQAKEDAAQGVEKMQRLLKSMMELEKSSNEVSKIIKVIDDMAFQTNILSLNAAVEAARAGDAGKGFAVVAEEVRNLAQRSAQAAKDTSALIDGNVALTKTAARVSEQVGDELRTIDSGVGKVKELLDEISTASQEQVIGVGQISQALSQIESVIQAQSAIAVSSSQEADALEQYCHQMRTAVGDLVNVIKNAAHDKPEEHTAPRLETKSKPKHEQRPQLTSGASERRGSAKTPDSGKLIGAKAVNPEDVIPLEDF